MFENFDPNLFADPEFKEDSVREVIIAPMLSKLGYHPSGDQRVVRSKTLVQPFIYVGTRQHPVRTIPDYTLYFQDKPVLVLDAKAPNESVTASDHVQQAYSYAIHPEVRTQHFCLCNGRTLALYNVENTAPLLNIPFEQFESRWEDIEKHLKPKYLIQPALRRFAPDLGMALTRLGIRPTDELFMIPARFGLVAKVAEGLISASVNTSLADKDHCASFDFKPEQLPLIVAGLPQQLRAQFVGALSRAPFQAAADLCIEVDIRTHLGSPISVEHETFVPLVIDEVLGSRFNPNVPTTGGADIPLSVFRLSKAFQIGRENQ